MQVLLLLAIVGDQKLRTLPEQTREIPRNRSATFLHHHDGGGRQVTQFFRDLTVWQKGLELAEAVYATSAKFPREEMFGLTSQMRRAAVSIPSNIAEGKAVGGQSYPRHIRIALGSEAELQTQIELACRLKLINQTDANALLSRTSQVGRMLVALLKALPKGGPMA